LQLSFLLSSPKGICFLLLLFDFLLLIFLPPWSPQSSALTHVVILSEAKNPVFTFAFAL